MRVPHLMTLADLSPKQIQKIVGHSYYLKSLSKPWMEPNANTSKLRMPSQSLFNKTIALVFNKRSTRTRVAAETAAVQLGGRAMFLGSDDIQLGVNETLRDSARVIGGMCQGIFARVGDHAEIEELAAHSPVPVLNALSSLWHPTQILADLLTLQEHAHLFDTSLPHPESPVRGGGFKKNQPYFQPLNPLPRLTVAYVGDSANVLHDMLVTYPRLGCRMRIASPNGYRAPEEVWKRVTELECDKGIYWTEDPKDAVKGADVVVTDTWISMGQEAEKEKRLKDFHGYQVTEKLCAEGGANPNWKFMHCLPRKQDEVDDEVFYGPRSLVFPEADNRRWTTMGIFDLLYGRWTLTSDLKE
jgi:ornithine carbamoyltransferase